MLWGQNTVCWRVTAAVHRRLGLGARLVIAVGPCLCSPESCPASVSVLSGSVIPTRSHWLWHFDLLAIDCHCRYSTMTVGGPQDAPQQMSTAMQLKLEACFEHPAPQAELHLLQQHWQPPLTVTGRCCCHHLDFEDPLLCHSVGTDFTSAPPSAKQYLNQLYISQVQFVDTQGVSV